MLFALNDRISFNAVPNWIKEFRKNVKKGVALVLVGNKKDLVNERIMSEKEAKTFGEKEGIAYYETSTKLGGKEINQAYFTLASTILSVINRE